MPRGKRQLTESDRRRLTRIITGQATPEDLAIEEERERNPFPPKPLVRKKAAVGGTGNLDDIGGCSYEFVENCYQQRIYLYFFMFGFFAMLMLLIYLKT